MTPAPCPWCAHEVRMQPPSGCACSAEPGDVKVCAHCVGPFYVGADLTLKRVTQSALATLASQERHVLQLVMAALMTGKAVH